MLWSEEPFGRAMVVFWRTRGDAGDARKMRTKTRVERMWRCRVREMMLDIAENEKVSRLFGRQVWRPVWVGPRFGFAYRQPGGGMGAA